jgi:hypothetical protein
MPDAETTRMLRDYMENGFLENIIDMFRQDPALWSAVPEMITDERSRVRIGTIALAETFSGEHEAEIAKALPDIALNGLGHPEPTIRGDAVFLMSSTGLAGAVQFLEKALGDEGNPVVRGEIEEAIKELREA